MKTEDQAWQDLQRHASAQLRSDFASRVLLRTNGPSDAAWQRLRHEGARKLRVGFAERVLRAARALPHSPSLLDQLAFSAGTAALCLAAVVFSHAHATHLQEERNLAGWQQLAAEVQDLDSTQ
jgi:hypothetical protein